jgi:hypothetical protein
MSGTPVWFQIVCLILSFLAGCGVGGAWVFFRLAQAVAADECSLSSSCVDEGGGGSRVLVYRTDVEFPKR